VSGSKWCNVVLVLLKEMWQGEWTGFETAASISLSTFLLHTHTYTHIQTHTTQVMKGFDDAIPKRRFDNFQFVNFTNLLMKQWTDFSRMEAQFALQALMEVGALFVVLVCLGLARTNTFIPLCRYGIFGRVITKYMIIYGAYIWF